MIYGIDIGPYTKKVDWALLKEKGVEFAIIKATQGDYLMNQYCAAMAEGAAAAGMVVGLYHWCDPLRDGKRQAEYFLNKVRDLPIHFAAVDIEQMWADWNEWPTKISKYLKPEVISASGKATTEAIQEGMDPHPNPLPGREGEKKKVVVYTRASFVHEYALPMTKWLMDWPLWIAHWAYNAGRENVSWEGLFGNGAPYTLRPALPKGCLSWVFHQWSGDRYVLPGMNEVAVDLNSFAGTVSHLRQWAGLSEEASKDDLLARLEEETENFMINAQQLEKALKDYIQSVRGSTHI